MTSLGYQAEYTTLQCAEYGTPQSRRRVIFWASQLGYPLPSFPQPENVVEHGSSTPSWHKTRRSAPHPVVSIGAAISDLPAFEWINPHQVIAQTAQDRSDRALRQHKISQVEVEQAAHSVGKNHQSYASRPLSEFQRQARAGVPQDGLLNHVTIRSNQETVERVCNIPMLPGADHRDMPKKLQLNCLTNETAKRNCFYPGRFGRLDYEGIFQTCMTDISPSGKNGKVWLRFLKLRVVSNTDLILRSSTPHSTVRFLSESTLELRGMPDSFDFDFEVIKVTVSSPRDS
jgi:site-specific DNA-cytosine methylase